MTRKTNWANELSNFIGTNAYWPICKFAVLTDGTKFLADQAEAYWLMYAIASYLPELKSKHEFAVAELSITHSAAVLLLTDGNHNELARQAVEYTDFPLPSITMYTAWAGDFWVIMLPSEY